MLTVDRQDLYSQRCLKQFYWSVSFFAFISRLPRRDDFSVVSLLATQFCVGLFQQVTCVTIYMFTLALCDDLLEFESGTCNEWITTSNYIKGHHRIAVHNHPLWMNWHWFSAMTCNFAHLTCSSIKEKYKQNEL